jgi:hypothetical protein
LKGNPLVFKGGYDLDGAQSWVRGVEKIFKTNDDTTVLAVSIKEEMMTLVCRSLWVVR